MADLNDFNYLIEIGPDGTHPDATSGRKKEFHFDLGDSDKGPIGYCAVIVTHDADAAVAALQQVLPDEAEIDHVLTLTEADDRLDYIQGYFNHEAISIRDIDYWNYADDD